ncbi:MULTISPECIES: DUF6438 domain-containing protein [Niastella]|uniref:DUF6438 domain-containing protein n=1 Tax=Niastella soli TaxID=2821487 RepID=A0ABS3YZ33_9BACT|nr:DUF6438 domain-containing protein [Niastella soli]MBO9203191.1 hypothetical protein [Niastella soli]
MNEDRHKVDTIFYLRKKPLLVVTTSDLPYGKNKIVTRTDTLIWQPSGLINYNPHPDHLKIEQINFTTTSCYGTCPVFQLTISPDKSAAFNGIRYNTVTGKFKSTIDKSTYKQLIKTINSIKLTALKNDYDVDWTDDQSVKLEIKYNNGQVKKIDDYGAIGTFGLENLYNQLFAIAKTQHWEKDESPESTQK